MTCEGLLKLCDSIALFSNDEYEVWVRGEKFGEAKPITSLVSTQTGLLLTCEVSQPTHSTSVCRMKDLVGRLREMMKTIDAETMPQTYCCVGCQDESGASRYFDLANERPLSFMNDEYVVFALEQEQFDWIHFLVKNPERATEFDGWGRLGGFSIARLLSAQPQFADRVDLRKLKPLAWIRLLQRQPQFAAKCDKWEAMRQYAPVLVERLHDR